MKRLFKFRYPKLLALGILTLIAYLIFSDPIVAEKISNLSLVSYFAVFIAGLLFTFGFTTPFAVGFFLVATPPNILISALLGGFGAMLADLAIFKIIKFSFMDEFKRIKRAKTMKKIDHLVSDGLGKKLKTYVLFALAGIIIASPLPDEVGVTMLAGLTHIKPSSLALISFVFNSTGIFIMLLIGSRL